VVDVGVSDDDGAYAVSCHADGFERAGQVTRLAHRPGRAGVDQNRPLTVVNEILVEYGTAMLPPDPTGARMLPRSL
jgi:hypothetical protein